MHHRLNSPLWRHDAYTLRQLQGALERCIVVLSNDGVLRRGKSRIVDLGAGDVPYRPLFAPHSAEYVACDISPGADIDLVFREGDALPLETGSVDCVVSFQVLEHVWDLDAYLGECRRLLAPDGRLLVSTHGTWLYHPHPGDYRRWTRDGLCRELEARGFEVMRVDAVVGPLAWTTQFRTFAYHHVLSRIGWPGRLAASALCLAMHLRMWLEDRITPRYLRETNAAIYCILARPSPKP